MEKLFLITILVIHILSVYSLTKNLKHKYEYISVAIDGLTSVFAAFYLINSSYDNKWFITFITVVNTISLYILVTKKSSNFILVFKYLISILGFYLILS